MERFGLECEHLGRLSMELTAVGSDLSAATSEAVSLSPARGPSNNPAAGLPRGAKVLVVTALLAGLGAVSAAIVRVASHPRPDGSNVRTLLVLGAVVVANWLWPLIIYRGEASEAVHLDEAVLVIMALLLPGGWTLLVFAAATTTAQLLRRRSLIKTLFNFGQLSTAVGLALVCRYALIGRTVPLDLGQIAAAAFAAVVFFALNSGAVTAILAATGTAWRASLLDGLAVRLSLIGAGILTGELLALTISAYSWSLPLVVLGLLMLRWVLAAHFSGRHDRQRLRGLLDATSEANRNLQRADIFDSIFNSARILLRCPEVAITTNAPESGQLGARLVFDGELRWLIASGRSRAEAFDAADAAVLEALASVAAGALTNALLYQQVGYQRQRLTAITCSLGEGVCALDTSGAITFANPAALSLLGWTLPPLALADAGEEGFMPAPSFLAGPARVAMDSHEVIRDEDATFCHHDGHPVPVAYTVSAIIDNGASVGAVMAFRDLTDRKRVEDDRARIQSEHQALEARLHQNQRLESLGELAGGIAHDFNNLLGVISNYASFISEQVSAAAREVGGERWEVAQQDSEQIGLAVERAAALTRQLLSFARREVVQPKVLDLNDLVTGIQQLLGRTLGEHVTVRTNLVEDLGPVMADPGQIEQVLVNLAVNARDAMPNGGILRIATSGVEIDESQPGPHGDLPGGRYAQLQVSDTGTGIPQHLIGRVCEPFFTTKARGEGSGLGLATVYGIISQAGGSLQIRSEPDVGTTFTVLLPVTLQEPQARTASAGPQLDGGGQTILLVEDERALREVTERILARKGFHVLAANDGQSALEITAAYPDEIHLLLTDLIMPRMLGKELAERITALRPAIQVLFMSGYAQPMLTVEGNLGPGVALLDKPFSEASLLKKVLSRFESSAEDGDPGAAGASTAEKLLSPDVRG